MVEPMDSPFLLQHKEKADLLFLMKVAFGTEFRGLKAAVH